MVCIIDDREDVWKFAPNLITVKKYVYFQGTGDIHAPSGPREPPARRRVNHSPKGADVPEHVSSSRDPEDGRHISGVEQSNGLGKSPRDWPAPAAMEERGARSMPRADGRGPPQQGRTLAEERPPQGPAAGDLHFELSSDSSSSSESEGRSSSASEGESGEPRSRRKPQTARGTGRAAPQGGERPAGPNHCGEVVDGPEEAERDGLCGLGGGCADRKEAETESQNSELSGITVGESLDQSVEEEEEEEDTDADDHLVHLEEILARVHAAYYAQYDRFLQGDLPEAPDIRKIVPELKSKVLANVTILFSGLHPTNFPVEKTREHYHASALGARILTQLVLDPNDPDRPTHLVAARAGTEKVRQAQECGQLHVVNPDWLWSCLERWDHVEEQLFPLREDCGRTHREDGPAAFPDRQSVLPPALFHPTPVHPRTQAGPELRIYDANTGKLIRKGAAGPGPPGSLAVHGEHSSFRVVQPPQQQMFGEELADNQEGTQPGPSRRKRQPSLSETLPLYTLCKEDLESMDKEVDDILGEGSDDSDSEKRKPEEEPEKGPEHKEPLTSGGPQRHPVLSAPSDKSAVDGRGPRGHKRKLMEAELGSASSGESSFEDEDEEGSSSEADEMAAALEAELSDLI